jgi:hypothetical protein
MYIYNKNTSTEQAYSEFVEGLLFESWAAQVVVILKCVYCLWQMATPFIGLLNKKCTAISTYYIENTLAKGLGIGLR